MSTYEIWRCRFLVRNGVLLAGVLAATSFAALPLASQMKEHGAERKVVNRVEPEYPDTLKRLYIGGVVRIEAVVAPNGTVESAQLLGGNPVLGQAAMKAVKQWKYAPGKANETLVVQLAFDPHR